MKKFINLITIFFYTANILPSGIDNAELNSIGDAQPGSIDNTQPNSV
jgi:hypothetical protein